jgi:hypothetical protein
MSSKAQRQVLIGLQSAAGTGVNVDVALRATCSLAPDPDKKNPDENIGSFAPARHYIGSIKPKGDLSCDAYYEHLPYMLSMGLGAGVVNAQASPLPDIWTFSLPDDAADDFALYTVEYSDGANHIVRAEDVFASAMEISGEAGQSWLIKNTLAGGEVTKPAALSATPSPPAGVVAVRMAETLLYIDDTFAGIGTTNVAELISFSWKIEELQHTKQFAGSLYPNGRGSNIWKVTLELVVEVETAEIEAELDKVLTTDQSAIRIAATSSSTRSCVIDGMYMLKEIDSLDDRDGNNTIKLTYTGEKDASDNTGSIVATVPELAAL